VTKRRVCVLGGAGFLGSHVADQLSESGYDVTVFDRGHSTWLRSDQKIFIGNIEDAESVNAAVEGCEYVYNFAALADLNQALDKPVETVRINVLGNVNVLEACRKHNVRRVIYASTIYVYSRQGGFYRCSKQAAEHYVEEYQQAFGLDYTVLRYGSLYGPRSNGANGLYRIVKQALQTGVVRYQGNPEAMREYIHVEDSARASVAVLGEEFRNQHVILTGQEPMRVYDMLKMLAEILGRPEAVEFLDNEYEGHYVRTPYAYQPRLGKKYVPSMHVDLGQGLLQLIDEVRGSLHSDEE